MEAFYRNSTASERAIPLCHWPIDNATEHWAQASGNIDIATGADRSQAMSNDRHNDNDQDTSAKDWNPWLEDDSSDDDLPSFSHDSDEEQAALRHSDTPPLRDRIDDDDGQDFDDADSWEDDELRDDEYQPTEASRFTDTWPVGLIAVAALALILLAAGGYGVMKQRAAMEQEIRDLQAQLAQPATPTVTGDTSAGAAALEDANRELQTALNALRDENRRLSDTVQGLEQQLSAQREAVALGASAAATTAAAAPRPAPPPVQAAPAGSGDWFVNFGSYSERSVAEQWSARLKPASGRVTVTSTQRDGSTYYRVRVVGLASDNQAQAVARKLEQDYDLPRLWVGRE
jgi:cell division protein FtsN